MSSRSRAGILPLDRPTEWLSLRDVASETHVKLQTLYRLRSEGRGPKAFRIGGQLRIRREDLNEWIEQGVDAA